jgi:hypothetical protein
MVPDLFFYQLVLVALLWLCLMLHGHDPNFRPTCETRGEPDVKTQWS